MFALFVLFAPLERTYQFIVPGKTFDIDCELERRVFRIRMVAVTE